MHRPIIFCLVLLFVTVSACSIGWSVPIRLQLNWIVQAEYAGFIAADYLGLYDEECLDVQILTGGQSIHEVDVLASGKADIAVTWLAQALQKQDQGVNISLIAQLARKAALVSVTWKKSGLTKITDLRGKKVCVWGNGQESNMKMAIVSNQMVWDTNWTSGVTTGDIDIVEQNFLGMSMFLNGSCDAASALRYSELGYILETVAPDGKLYSLDNITIIDFDALGTASMEDGLIVLSDWLKDNEDVVVRFLRATFKGWAWCRDHPDDAVSFFATKIAHQRYMLAETNKLLFPAPDGIGIVDEALIQRTADIVYRFNVTHNHWNISEIGFYRSDIARKALATMSNSGLQWGPTQFGPGSSDYKAVNYVGEEVEFCLGTNGVVIICPPKSDDKASRLGWVVAAWVDFFCIIFLCVASYGLLLTRSHEFPLRAMSLILNLLTTTGTLMFVNVPFRVIFFPYPCWVYYFVSMVAPTLFVTPILVAAYRHRAIYLLVQFKRRIAHKEPSPRDLTRLDTLKRYSSDVRLGIVTVIVDGMSAVIAGFGQKDASLLDGYATDNGTCHMGTVVGFGILAYWLFYLILLGGAVFLLQKHESIVGFRRYIVQLFLFGTFIGLLYGILVLVMQPLPILRDQLALILTLIPMWYQFFGVFLPCLQTFPLLTNSPKTAEENIEPLNEVIVTRRGFAWFFEHAKSEFSPENPLCWQAIQTFKTRTSYHGMKDIYTKYFAPGAPLAVNLSAGSSKDLRQSYDQAEVDTPLEVLQCMFDAVQVEILDLMQQDSYRRFLGSDFYQSYKRGEEVPRARRESASVKSQTVLQNDEPDYTTNVQKTGYGEIPATSSVSLSVEPSFEGSTPRDMRGVSQDGVELHCLESPSPSPGGTKENDHAWAVQ